MRSATRSNASFVPKYITSSATVRELARASDIIDRVTRQTISTKTVTRKGCERAIKTLNAVIVDILRVEGERDG